MRRNSSSYDSDVALILVALGLGFAVFVSLVADTARERLPENRFGFTSPLVEGQAPVRVNELPQIGG